VADHAKRAMSRFPCCEDHYYGVDYGKRARDGVSESEQPRLYPPNTARYAANDLSWYANIPVPTSYMCMGSEQDFVGGYDYDRQAGLLHLASHHIAPGKKQWTWGNHEFGYAWDRNLTEPDEYGEYAPYIELMSGVFTDNQPDFSYLMPGEVRKFDQYIYPLQQIGPAHHANLDAAVNLRWEDGSLRVGVSVTRVLADASVQLWQDDELLQTWPASLSPDQPLVQSIALPRDVALTSLQLKVVDCQGQLIITYQLQARKNDDVPDSATEPPLPVEIASADELYITGLHLEQYRHATRMPETYWREALRRDPLDSRCNTAMGRWHFQRGEFESAVEHFDKAVERLTRRNPNPRDGEAHYYRGLVLRYLKEDDSAYDSLYKATWNHAWQSAAFLVLAQIDCCEERWQQALEHLDRCIDINAQHLQARNLKAMVLRQLQQENQAQQLLQETLTIDPLVWMARHLSGDTLDCDTQTRLDITIEFMSAGFYEHALDLLEKAQPQAISGTEPMCWYYRAYLHDNLGQKQRASECYKQAVACCPDYCFPNRLEDIDVLASAIGANPDDAKAPYYLSNLYYDRKRHGEAIVLLKQSVEIDPTFATAWRNLGIASFNINHDPGQAMQAYDRAVSVDPDDARLVYERDQLCKRLGHLPQKRLEILEDKLSHVVRRDDLSIEYATLQNQTGCYAQALDWIMSRTFQPWEGGEGLALGQYTRSHLALGREALLHNDPERACQHFDAARNPSANLGEAHHLLANISDIHYWSGKAHAQSGDQSAAVKNWTLAAQSRGDFQEMSICPFSEMTYYAILSLQELGQLDEAMKLATDLRQYARQLEKQPAKIDYFATSLPTMLLFDDDLQERQTVKAIFLQGQADMVEGKIQDAICKLQTVLQHDPNHNLAADLLAQLQSLSNNKSGL
jgi:tetratricopeptide (TPR) repeat protein